MTPIEIVPMAAEHIPAIAEIERQCFSTPWSEKTLAEELDVPSAIFVTALIDGAVAGYMGMHTSGDIAYVCNVAVSPAYRRHGVASALIQAQIDTSVLCGIREISLEVRTSNDAAIGLYEKFGFKHLGTRPHFYSNPTENAEIYSLYI